MGRKLPPSEQLNRLIEQYETNKAANRQIYLDGDQFADIACQYLFEKRTEEAQEVINYGLHLHPDNTDLLIEQAYLYLDTRQIQKAEQVVACITESYDVAVKLLKAEILLHKGMLKATQELLATIDREIDLDVITNIVYLYMDMGYPDEAGKWLEKGRLRYGKEEDFLTLAVDYAVENQQNAQAIDLYNQLIDLNPYNSSYWVGLSKCHFIQNNIQEAIDDCDFALTANEQSGEAYSQRAICYYYAGNPEKAIEDYKKAIEYKGMAPKIGYWLMGMAYQDQERWKEAELCFKESIDRCMATKEIDLFIDIYTHTIDVLLHQGKTKEAHELYRKACQAFPDQPEIELTKGQIYLKEGEHDKAFYTFVTILEEIQDPDLWYDIGTLYEDRGEIGIAKFFYKKVYDMEPDYDDIAAKLAIIALIEGDFDGFAEYNSKTPYPIDKQAIGQILAHPENLTPEVIDVLKQMQNQLEQENN